MTRASKTTFTSHHLVPSGRAMLACSCQLPDGWVNVPLPDETVDLANPAILLPLLVCMAPYGVVVLTISARPAFDNGSVQDWAEYMAAQQGMSVECVREARINRMPCILFDATMASAAGLMRSRSVFLEDGRRLFNIGTLAPDALWSSVEVDFDHFLGSFALDETQGITAAPLRQMTSEPAVNLSMDAGATGVHEPAANARATDEHRPDAAKSNAATFVPDDRPSLPPDVVLANDAASPDPDLVSGERSRHRGAGRVPRVNPTSPQSAPPADPEFAGLPAWWRTAVMHERGDRLEEAEQAVLQSVDHIGVYSSLAHLYEGRSARLSAAGQHDAAKAAKARAIHWLYMYAGSATSGGEGAALSLERDERIAALGGEDSAT